MKLRLPVSRLPVSVGARLLAALLAVPLLGTAAAAPVAGQGTWETTLQPRDINNDGVADAYFDTDLDITWLGEAYIAQAYGFPPGRPILFWEDAVESTAMLDVDGVTGWRLPTVINVPNATGSSQRYCAPDADPRLCGASPDPSFSELAHMYYITLGGGANTGPFQDMQTAYWTGTGYGDGAWVFSASNGSQWLQDPFSPGPQAWAVHDGDIGIPMVPEPAAPALFAAGVAALAVALRKRSRSA